MVTHLPTQTKIAFFEHRGHCIYVPCVHCNTTQDLTHQQSLNTFAQDTVSERMKWYTSEQIKEARQAVAPLKTTGVQSWYDLKIAIRGGMTMNNPVTECQVDCAQDIWKDTAFIGKGASARKPPPKCIAHCVQVPKKLSQPHNNVHPIPLIVMA